jgi:hypothetical protein
MGKKVKDYDKMDFHEKKGYLRSQAKHYGVVAPDADVNNHREGLMSHTGLNLEDSVLKAMNNDYDLRESLKYGVESGNKHFEGLGTSVDSMTAAVGAHQAVMKYGKKDLKHKNTTSVNDFADISHSLFKESRANLTDSMTANEQQKEAETGAIATPSDRLQNARDTVDELGNKDYDVFGANIDNGDNQNQRDQASQAFLGKYKLDLKQKKNIKPVLPS